MTDGAPAPARGRATSRSSARNLLDAFQRTQAWFDRHLKPAT